MESKGFLSSSYWMYCWLLSFICLKTDMNTISPLVLPRRACSWGQWAPIWGTLRNKQKKGIHHCPTWKDPHTSANSKSAQIYPSGEDCQPGQGCLNGQWDSRHKFHTVLYIDRSLSECFTTEQGIGTYTLIYIARTVFLLSYATLKAIWVQLNIQKPPCHRGDVISEQGSNNWAVTV